MGRYLDAPAASREVCARVGRRDFRRAHRVPPSTARDFLQARSQIQSGDSLRAKFLYQYRAVASGRITLQAE
jgi:hypothetical protein